MPIPPVGQERALNALRRIADGGARTLLFAGPDGVGRRRAARWFAALLNCEARLDDPCGRCRACRAWDDAGDDLLSTTDYREIGAPTTTRDGRPARRRTITIDQLVPREGGDPEPLGPWLRTPPTGRVRVGVVDAADELGEAAANAFLTTLEAPPDHARIVLIASGPDGLLPTVASRCTVVRFVPVQADEATWRRVGAHPALRLGRPARLGDDDAERAARDAVDAFDAALEASLGATFVALDALQVAWERDEERVTGLLREAARARDAAAYVAADTAIERASDALAAYAHRSLVLKRLAMELRAAWRASTGA